jgi:hypothetical protein
MRAADISLKTASVDSVSKFDTDKSIEVTLTPNPASGNVVVSINQGKTSAAFVKSIKVLDISGKTLKTFSYSNGTQTRVTLDVSELKAGIYLIDVFDGRNNFIKKLIIQ